MFDSVLFVHQHECLSKSNRRVIWSYWIAYEYQTSSRVLAIKESLNDLRRLFPNGRTLEELRHGN